MRASEIAAAIFLLLAAASVFAQEPQPDDQPKSIHGTVITSVTKNPVTRALVMSTDNRFAAMTDSEGHFEFVLPKDETEDQSNSGITVYFSTGSMGPLRISRGQVWLRARKPGFIDDWHRGDSNTAATPGVDTTISLVPEALIKGHVSLSTGDVATNMSVQLYERNVVDGMPPWMPGISTRANSAGEFRFAEFLPDAIEVQKK